MALSFLDICRTGAVTQDWLAVVRPFFEAEAVPKYVAAVANPPAQVEPPSAPAAYLGTYENDFYGALEVVEEGERLELVLGPNSDRFPLTHYTHDVFTYVPVGENAGGPSAVTFTIGPDDRASHVVLDILDAYGTGTFVRPAPEAAPGD